MVAQRSSSGGEGRLGEGLDTQIFWVLGWGQLWAICPGLLQLKQTPCFKSCCVGWADAAGASVGVCIEGCGWEGRHVWKGEWDGGVGARGHEDAAWAWDTWKCLH